MEVQPYYASKRIVTRVGDCPLSGALLVATECLKLAGQRPSSSAAAASLAGLHLRLLGNLQCIVNFDPQIPDGAFELRVSEQQLNGSEILSPSVDQRRLGTPQ